MGSKFVAGFEKTALLGPVAGAVGTAAKWAGKKVLKAAGGPLNTALTVAGAAGDFADANRKMVAAASR